jgi:exopolysaccharide production protein ExoZ
LKLQSIQVLRAIAVVAVVMFHCTTFRVGRAGVDLFFCISGYVMAGQMGRTPVQFAVDRFTRIYPPFLAALAMLFLINGMPGDPLRLVRSLLLFPSYHAIYLYPAWSLGYEAMFYGGCVAAMLLGVPAVLILFAAAFLLHLPYVGSALVLEFLAGFALARRRWIAMPVLLVAAIGDPRVLSYAPAAILLLWLCIKNEKFFRLDWFGPVVLVGDASYSIYLIHTIIAGRLAAQPWPAIVCACVAAGIAFHFGLEKPLVKIARSFDKRAHVRRRGVQLELK